MPFSPPLMEAIRKEAMSLGFRSPTAISVALREQLTAERTGDNDGRAKDYWIAARVVNKGWATPLPGVLKILGMDAVFPAAVQAAGYVGVEPPTAPPTAQAINAARVGLTRNSMAHFVLLLPFSAQPPGVPDAWVDVWAFKSEASAAAYASTLKAGKIF